MDVVFMCLPRIPLGELALRQVALSSWRYAPSVHSTFAIFFRPGRRAG